MAEAKRDGNYVTTLLGITDDGNQTPTNLIVDPTTKRLKVSATLSAALADLSDVTITNVQDGDVLTYDTGSGDWINQAPAGGGDFSGPASSTDNAVVRFDGTGGKTGQNSVVIIDDSGNVTGLGTLNTLNLPSSDFSGVSDAETLTNKTIDANNNTISNLAIGAEVSSSITNDVNVAASTAFLIGSATQITTGNTHEFQVLGAAPNNDGITIGKWGANANESHIDFVKSRNATIGSNTIVQDNDAVGGLRFFPDDGVDFATEAAAFHAEVDDASPAAGDIGMAFVWQQMPGGAGAIRETMRLAADGSLTLAVGGIDIPASTAFSVAGTNILSDSAGTMTLSNVDALDATTEATIEGAIDTLANLTSIQGHTVTLTGDFIRSGAHSLTLTTTASTNVTLPTSGTLMANLVEDTTPQLGGTLDAQDNNITGLGSVGFTQELDNGSKTASFSIDFGTDQKQKVTLTANTMTLTLDTTFDRVGNYLLKIVNGGLATLTWASETGSVKWPGGTAPTLTSSGTDIVTFYYDGTDWHGVASLAFA